MPVGLETCRTPAVPQWRNSDFFYASLSDFTCIKYIFSFALGQLDAFTNRFFYGFSEPASSVSLSFYSMHKFAGQATQPLLCDKGVWLIMDREAVFKRCQTVKDNGDEKRRTRPRHPIQWATEKEDESIWKWCGSQSRPGGASMLQRAPEIVKAWFVLAWC